MDKLHQIPKGVKAAAEGAGEALTFPRYTRVLVEPAGEQSALQARLSHPHAFNFSSVLLSEGLARFRREEDRFIFGEGELPEFLDAVSAIDNKSVPLSMVLNPDFARNAARHIVQNLAVGESSIFVSGGHLAPDLALEILAIKPDCIINTNSPEVMTRCNSAVRFMYGKSPGSTYNSSVLLLFPDGISEGGIYSKDAKALKPVFNSHSKIALIADWYAFDDWGDRLKLSGHMKNDQDRGKRRYELVVSDFAPSHLLLNKRERMKAVLDYFNDLGFKVALV